MSLADVDLTDLDRFAAGFPHDTFARLREEAPVWWHPPTPRAPGGEGFWVISRYAELLRIARDPQTFSSETGPGRRGGGTTLEDMPPGVVTGVMLNMSDPPTHTRIRSLVSRAFAPRTLARLEPWLRARSREIVAAARAKGECDFLADVAAELPLQTIGELLGVPPGDRHALFRWTGVILDYRERELAEVSPELAEAGAGLRSYGQRLLAEKRRAPGDDLLSAVVHARLPGEAGPRAALSEAELQAFFSLLFVAGSETTRNSLAGGLLALLERRDQLERLCREPGLLPRAVEEILRWTSATAYNRRTATADVLLCGQRIRAGEKTTHWYPSANRDASVFADPFRFDVARDPNPHLAFGHGLHHCLGANLARREIAILLEELLPELPGVEQTGPAVWGRSNKHTSLRHLPVRFGR